MKLCSAVLALALSVSSFAAMADTAPAPADDAARQAAAERYFATQDIDAEVNGVVTNLGNMIQNPAVTPEQKAGFIAYAHEHLDHTALKAAMIDAMTATYTTDELNALADFFGSPLGKSISGKSKAFRVAAGRSTLPVALGFLASYAKDCTDKSKCLELSMLMPVAPVAPPVTPPAAK